MINLDLEKLELFYDQPRINLYKLDHFLPYKPLINVVQSTLWVQQTGKYEKKIGWPSDHKEINCYLMLFTSSWKLA